MIVSFVFKFRVFSTDSITCLQYIISSFTYHTNVICILISFLRTLVILSADTVTETIVTTLS